MYPMKIWILIPITFLCLTLINCASAYREINPGTINFISGSITDSVSLQYKYDLLTGRYGRNEYKHDVKIVALKITNNTNRDLIYGKDIILAYSTGNPVNYTSTKNALQLLKQHPASYLWYLLLSPLNLYITSTDSRGFEEQTNSFPIGLIVGPGLAVGNAVASGTANRKFKSELLQNELLGVIIKKGETRYGLLALNSASYDALQLQIKP